MQITINLATRPFVDLLPLLTFLKRTVSVLGCANIFVGLMVYVGHSSLSSARSEAHALDKTVASQSEELLNYRKVMQRPENVLLAERTNALNQLFDEKAFSWTLLMLNLEGDVPSDVQLASIQPVREKDGSISLRFRVTGPRSRILELLANLEKTPCFVLPRILGENAKEDPGTRQPPHALNETSVEEFEVATGYDEALAAIRIQNKSPGVDQPAADANPPSGAANPSIARGRK